MEPQEAEPELFATDDTSQSDAKADEPVVLEKTDSEILDFDDTSGTSDMHRPKSHLAGSGVRGQEANKATTSKQQVKTSSGLKTQSSAAGSKSRNVTTKAKGSILYHQSASYRHWAHGAPKPNSKSSLQLHLYHLYHLRQNRRSSVWTQRRLSKHVKI